MRKCVLTLFTLLSFIDSFAQDAPPRKYAIKSKHANGCPRAYLGIGTGINNSIGILGLACDIRVAPFVSIEEGLGISTWGPKFSIAGKYYLKPCNNGWAFGAGMSHNLGIKHFHNTMETIYSRSENVILTLHPVTNLFLAAYNYVRLGNGNSRFYTTFGYSVPLGAKSFEQVRGHPITRHSERVMKFLTPGGIVFGMGFSFALGS